MSHCSGSSPGSLGTHERSGAVLWALVALGLLVIVTRRRSIAVALVTAQALILVAIALDQATRHNDVAVAVALAARAVALAALFGWLAFRTRSPRPIRAAARPFVRAGVACRACARVGLACALTRSQRPKRRAGGARARRVRPGQRGDAPPDALPGDRDRAGRERGRACRARAPGSPSLLVELGVALDLTLIALVAALFHFRIFAEFGTADTTALTALRD